jgi:high-affinity iron transporter
MLLTFLIMLREGLEAALIIGIMASYVVQRGRAGALPSIWTGAAAAVAVSIALGAALTLSGLQFPQREQEIFEAVVGVVALLLLMSMLFWMRQTGRRLRGEIEGQVSRTMGTAGFSLALAGTAFLIVGREGVESVMFVVAIVQQAPGLSMLAGALLGLAAAFLLAVLIFRFGVRIDLARFFRITGVFVLLVAAGLAAGVLRSLHEAGIWNLLQDRAYDLSHVLPADGPLGVLLSGIFGYSDAPTWGEVLAYLAVLLPSLWLFLRPLPQRKATSPTGATAKTPI